MNKNSKSHIQRPYNFPVSIMITLATCIAIYLSYHTFYIYKDTFQKLRNGDWRSISLEVNQQVEFKFVNLVIGSQKIQVKHLGKIKYEQNCNRGLNYLCKHIKSGDLKPTKLKFYHLNLKSQTLLLQSITFIDEDGIQQLFEYSHSTPNNAQYINDQKLDLKPFYFFTLISYLILGYLAYFHHLLRYSNSLFIVEISNATLLIIFITSYFYFGFSYFFF